MTEKELLEALLAKMNGMESKMTTMETEMKSMRGEMAAKDDLDEITQSLGRTEKRMTQMEGSLARMENELGTKVAALFGAREVQNDTNEKFDSRFNQLDTKIDRIAADVTFLVRKAAQHEDDIRSLRQIK